MKMRKMRRWVPILAGVLIGGYAGCRASPGPSPSPSSPAPASASAAGLQKAFTQVAGNVGPAVVSIRTSQEVEVTSPYYWAPFEDWERFFQEWFGQNPLPHRPQSPPPRRRQKVETGLGSGVVIHEKGYVLTNYHVLRDAQEITVTFYNDDKQEDFPGKVIGKDEMLDLAVVKLVRRPKELPVARMGDSDKIRVGDWAIAIGSPFGLAQTVTAGIVSARRQRIQIEGRVYENLIQTDAAINRGNSGGPLVNIAGEVIGINTAIFTPSGAFAGVGFAIPINRAKEILEDLIEKGRVVRGWLGVTIKPVDDAVARQFGLPAKAGLLVQDLQPDGPAAKGGLKPGDVILSFDGKRVDSAESLQRLVRHTDPKSRVSVELFRNRKRQTLTVRLGEMPSNPETAFGRGPAAKEEEGSAPGAETQGLGATVRPLDPKTRAASGLSAAEGGVIVTEVNPDSAAGRLGLQSGDVVLKINRQPTPDPNSYEKAAGSARLSEGIVAEVMREGSRLFLSAMER